MALPHPVVNPHWRGEVGQTGHLESTDDLVGLAAAGHTGLVQLIEPLLLLVELLLLILLGDRGAPLLSSLTPISEIDLIKIV